jgi:predicted DNA-binding transcriptional regulator YafY
MSVNRSTVLAAIKECRVVELRYQGDASSRVVHPHILYRTAKGKECIDAYQISGPTHGGNLPAWRPFELRRISAFAAQNEQFSIAPGYNPASPKYRHGVLARVG